MAVRAICSSEDGSSRRVDGIVGVLPSREVAAGVPAIRWGDLQVVVVVDVAGSARNIGVAVGERETGRVVIEFCVEPSIERMARFASGGEIRAGVIRIGGFPIVL